MDTRILIADDTKINLSVLKNILLKHKCLVETASTGSELLEKFEESKYDLMFVDIQMPEFKGDEAFIKLKQNYANLPYTIAISAVEYPDEIENYNEIGFNDFMSKPITEVKVKLILDKFLENIH